MKKLLKLMLKNYPLRDKEEGQEGEENGGNGENGAGTDTAADEWKENEHPRDEDGKFKSGSGTSTHKGQKEKMEDDSQKKEAEKSAIKKYKEDLKAGRREVSELVEGKKFGENAYFNLQIKDAPVYNLSNKVNLYQDLEEVEDALKELKGKPINNEQTGTAAFVNSNQRGKLISEKAVTKSIKNGFSREEHYAAAALVGSIFPHAILHESNKDKGQFSKEISIRRYVANIRLKNGNAYAKYTVKSSEENGQRIYSVELEELEKYQ